MSTELAPVAGRGGDASNRQFWSLVARNRFLILAALVFTPLLSYVMASLVTPVYEGTATVSIEKKAAPVSAIIDPNRLDKVDVAAEIELLASRTLAEATVDSLALHVRVTRPFAFLRGGALLSPPRPVSRAQMFSVLIAARDARPAQFHMRRQADATVLVTDRTSGKPVARLKAGEPAAVGDLRLVLADSARDFPDVMLDVVAFNDAVGELRATLDVRRPSRDVNTVAVSFQSTDPALARDVPNALLTRFIEVRREINKTEARSTVRFLRQQLDTIGSQLALSEDRLVAFRGRNPSLLARSIETGRPDRDVGRLQQDRVDRQVELQSLTQVLTEVQSTARSRGPDSTSAYWRLMAFPRLLPTIQPRHVDETKLRRLRAVIDEEMAHKQIGRGQPRVMHPANMAGERVEHPAAASAVATLSKKLLHRLRAVRRFSEDEGKLLPQRPAVLPVGDESGRLQSRRRQQFRVLPFPPRDGPHPAPAKHRGDSVLLVRPPASLEKEHERVAIVRRGLDAKDVAPALVVLDQVAPKRFHAGKRGEPQLFEQRLMFGDDNHDGLKDEAASRGQSKVAELDARAKGRAAALRRPRPRTSGRNERAMA